MSISHMAVSGYGIPILLVFISNCCFGYGTAVGPF